MNRDYFPNIHKLIPKTSETEIIEMVNLSKKMTMCLYDKQLLPPYVKKDKTSILMVLSSDVIRRFLLKTKQNPFDKTMNSVIIRSLFNELMEEQYKSNSWFKTFVDNHVSGNRSLLWYYLLLDSGFELDLREMLSFLSTATNGLNTDKILNNLSQINKLIKTDNPDFVVQFESSNNEQILCLVENTSLSLLPTNQIDVINTTKNIEKHLHSLFKTNKGINTNLSKFNICKEIDSYHFMLILSKRIFNKTQNEYAIQNIDETDAKVLDKCWLNALSLFQTKHPNEFKRIKQISKGVYEIDFKWVFTVNLDRFVKVE